MQRKIMKISSRSSLENEITATLKKHTCLNSNSGCTLEKVTVWILLMSKRNDTENLPSISAVETNAKPKTQTK